jgi:hypothetical protein
MHSAAPPTKNAAAMNDLTRDMRVILILPNELTGWAWWKRGNGQARAHPQAAIRVCRNGGGFDTVGPLIARCFDARELKD